MLNQYHVSNYTEDEAKQQQQIYMMTLLELNVGLILQIFLFLKSLIRRRKYYSPLRFSLSAGFI